MTLDFVSEQYSGGAIAVARSTSAMRQTVSGLVVANQNTPRINYDEILQRADGLLIEEARLNRAISPNFAGAIAGQVGSGGSLPTSWSRTSINGLPVVITAVGADYIEAEYVATPTASGVIMIFPCGTGLSGLAAVAGESWITSSSLKITDAIGVTAPFVGMRSYDAAGTQIDSVTSAIKARSDAPFPHRFRRTTVANTAFVAPAIIGGTVTNGTPVVFRFRIERPQAEKAANYKTSFQPAANRAADDATVTGWSIAGLNSWSARVLATPLHVASTGSLLEASDGTVNNRVEVYISNFDLKLRVVSGGITLTDTRIGGVPGVSRSAVVLGVSPTGIVVSVNGKPAKTVSLTPPTGLSTIKVGSGVAGYWNSTIQRLDGWVSSLSASQVVAASLLGQVFFDDYDRSDGALGISPTGHSYYQATTTNGVGSSAPALTAISGGMMKTPAGSGISASYTSVDPGSAKMVQSSVMTFPSGITDSLLLLLSNSLGWQDVETTVKSGSTHTSFGAGAITYGYFPIPKGSLINYATSIYQLPNALRDGASRYCAAYALLGSDVIAYSPDGNVERVTPPVSQQTVAGRWHMLEQIISEAGQPVMTNSWAVQ
ncbi:hypothetical protein [Aliirhizobium smilacinae]|uniref:Uncharacterized protein n=1 Tax=Aliirhizobium smilacinae TaxID=1395944 RepID=A0A5C4XPB3_9HYPH|nr:hypothetical protein [Rhizobium smilacinae]TNM65272.1 hypothetical protein FHP24_03045 [Rhizobium smilacinae]